MDDSEVVCLDSDSDFEMSTPKRPKRDNVLCRNTNRGRRKVAGRRSQQKENTRSNTTTAQILTLHTNADSPQTSTDATTEICIVDQSTDIVVPSVTAPPLYVLEDKNASLNLDDKPLPSDGGDSKTKPQETLTAQPRKTARRGLARKIQTESATTSGASSGVLTLSATRKKASVYSACVGHGFHGIYGSKVATDSQDNDKVTQSQELPQQEACILNSVEVDGRQRIDIGVSESAHSSSCDESEQYSSKSADDEETDRRTQNVLREPSPPPEVNKVKPHKMSRRVTKALNTLTKINAANCRATRKGRQLPIVESPVIVQVDSPFVKDSMIIKVLHMSKVYRLTHSMTQPFHVLLTNLSRELGEEEHSLGLFLRDISLTLSSTPKDVNLTVADIIECYSIADDEGESINVKIQCCNSRRTTNMVAYKRQPLQELMKRYVEKLELKDALSIIFCFDGEYVDPKDTPMKLDMEDGDMLDVVPKKSGKELAHAQNAHVIVL